MNEGTEAPGHQPRAGAAQPWVIPTLVLIALVVAAWTAWRSLVRTTSVDGPAAAGLGVERGTAAPNALRGFAIDPPKPAPDVVLVDTDDRAWRGDDLHGTVWALFFGYTRCPDVCPQTLAAMSGAMAALDQLAAADPASQGGSPADAVTLAMVTVDPERDTPRILADYVHGFDPRFIGLTGSPAAIRATADGWGVAFEREVPPAAATAAMAVVAGHGEGDSDGEVNSGAHATEDADGHAPAGHPPDDDIGLIGPGAGSGAYTVVHSGMVFLIDRQGRLRDAFVGAINPADVAHDLALLIAEPAP